MPMLRTMKIAVIAVSMVNPVRSLGCKSAAACTVKAIRREAEVAAALMIFSNSGRHEVPSNRGRKTGPIAPMKYGDERDILNATMPIVAKLLRGIAGKGFDFKNSRRIDRNNAQSLWGPARLRSRG
jgi:hypothetical protein